MEKFVEIKNCPVCGGRDFARIEVHSIDGFTSLSKDIKGCKKCGCVVLSRKVVQERCDEE